jgi:hypothetical protein
MRGRFTLAACDFVGDNPALAIHAGLVLNKDDLFKLSDAQKDILDSSEFGFGSFDDARTFTPAIYLVSILR